MIIKNKNIKSIIVKEKSFIKKISDFQLDFFYIINNQNIFNVCLEEI